MESKMKLTWKTSTTKGKKYKNGSTASFKKTSVNGKTKWVKEGYSGKQPKKS